MNREQALIIGETQAWVERVVIGLNLCPFAKAAQVKGQVRYVLAEVTDPQALLATLCDELRLLASTDPAEVETTLLIHPRVLTDFTDYNNFLDLADEALVNLRLDGELQIASFHPDYQFADAGPDDLSNATNRSPYPCLHLLREASIERAVEAFPEPETIYEANIRTLDALGPAGWVALRAACRTDAERTLPDVGPEGTERV